MIREMGCEFEIIERGEILRMRNKNQAKTGKSSNFRCKEKEKKSD